MRQEMSLMWRGIGTICCVLLLSGCSGLKRIEGTFNGMVGKMGVVASHMPIMAESTGRMVKNVDRMENRARKMLDGITKASPKYEHYFEEYEGSDKAIVETLDNIHRDLRAINNRLRSSVNQSQVNYESATYQEAQARLEGLEARLHDLYLKTERLEK
jgi:hypothetical protein